MVSYMRDSIIIQKTVSCLHLYYCLYSGCISDISWHTNCSWGNQRQSQIVGSNSSWWTECMKSLNGNTHVDVSRRTHTHTHTHIAMKYLYYYYEAYLIQFQLSIKFTILSVAFPETLNANSVPITKCMFSSSQLIPTVTKITRLI